MIKIQSDEWNNFLTSSLQQILNNPLVKFSDLKPAMLPKKQGVYLIVGKIQNEDVPLYVGRTKNIRRRLYSNHLMGSLANARLKKYLIEEKVCLDKEDAKRYILMNCSVTWIFEEDHRKRGALEGYIIGKLFPMFGIGKEH